MEEKFKVKALDQEFMVDILDQTFQKGKINGTTFDYDIQKIGEHSFHILHHHESYNVHVVSVNREEKKVKLQINGINTEFEVKDRLDLLLQEMGLDALNQVKFNEVKAPMPGLVLNIMVQAGDIVKKGDPLIILEAMKMENVIKSAGEGKVKKINVQKGNAVEKGALLVQFE